MTLLKSRRAFSFDYCLGERVTFRVLRKLKVEYNKLQL